MIEGRVTGISDGAIEGWIAADPTDGEVHVEALADRRGPFGRVRAAPGPDGRLHFRIEIPEDLRDGEIRFLDVRPLGAEQPLPGGPVVFDGGLFDAPQPTVGPPPAVNGSLVALAVEGWVGLSPPGLVEGWAWAPARPDLRLKLEILAGGRFVAAITADKPRDDLKAAGTGDGRYGFWFDAARLLRRGPHVLTVRVEGMAEPLPGGPLRAGPFAADGEADCPGYLDTPEQRLALETMPFEHLAFDARRIAPDRLTPRLINRLRRERTGLADAAPGLNTLLLPGEGAAPAAAVWALQSHPRTSTGQASLGPAAIRALARDAARVFFAAPGDLMHPSAALVTASLGEADVVTWNRFCADEPRAGSAGWVLRRPAFDPVTARCGAVTDTTLAVRGETLAGAPEEVLRALAAGRLHPLWFWLAGAGLSWRHHPEALTSRVGLPAVTASAGVPEDEAFYRGTLAAEGAHFTLERARDGASFPYVLAPVRRAVRTSVLISFRNRRDLTLRCLAALARQRLSGEIELVLVDNQSHPEETAAILDGAQRLFGDDRVKLVGYDRPFSHSAQNNLAARAASGEALVFCNNDVVLKDPALIEQLAAWALQPGIGAVGCRLDDPDRGIGSYGHAFPAPSGDPFQPPLRETSEPSYAGFVHACPGATLALAAFDRARFLALGGLDEARFPIGYNDIDIMLRATRQGLTHLYLGHLVADHVRGSSRTGDNEGLQALWINQRYPEAALGHLQQLARERIETHRPELAGKRRRKTLDARSEAESLAALEGEITAREAHESRRAQVAEAFVRASGLVRTLGEELAAARALED